MHVKHNQWVGTRRSPSPRGLLLISLAAVLGVVVGFAVARLTASDDAPGPGWVRVGSVQEIRTEGVVLLPDVPAYVVAEPPRTPIALLARSPHLGEQVMYCESSMWFEDPAHGDKFDRLGNYVLGPAPRGLDRLETLVQDGVVWVNPSGVMPGPPRGSYDGMPPAGPFCSGSE